jgi:hypothetical protein
MKCKCSDIFFLCNNLLGKILVYFEKNLQNPIYARNRL